MSPARRWRWLRRGLQVLLGLILVAAAVGVWLAPARRNFYGRRSHITARPDLVYVEGSTNPKHQLDLYLPQQPVSRAFPLVVFVHGGIGDPFDRRLLQPILGLHGVVGVALANRGVGVAVIGYRQHPQAATLDDSLLDIARAVRFVLDHAAAWGGDPQRVVLVGHSFGGTLVSLLALDPARLARGGVERAQVRGFASLGAAYDLRGLVAYFATSGEKEKATTTMKVVGGDAGIDRFSPDHQALQADHPPLLLLAGRRDDEELLREHRLMVQALAATPQPPTVVETGDTHMSMLLEMGTDRDETTAPLLRFIEQVTATAPAAPPPH